MRKNHVAVLLVLFTISVFLVGQATPQCGSMLWVYGDGKVTTEALVGIGTTDPEVALDVRDDENPKIRLGFDHDNSFDLIFWPSNIAGIRTRSDNFPISLGNHFLYVSNEENEGNVGIGTTNPYHKLQIKGEPGSTDETVLALEKDGGWSIGQHLALDWVDGQTGRNVLARIAVEPDAEMAFNLDFYSSLYSELTHVMRLTDDGKVGIGTTNPQHKLDVEGTVQAHAFDTGDIVFRKDGKKLWRMFEDENGLYLENLSTNETSKVFLEKDIESLKAELKEEIRNEEIANLKAEIKKEILSELRSELSN